MKGRFWLALTIAAAVFLALIIGVKAQASIQFRSGNNNATLSSGHTVDGSLWVAAKNLDIAGTVNGDVFCGSQTVEISGTIKGDLICGARTINVSGTVDGSVRLAARTVNLNGSIGRNASIAAQTINTGSKSRIAGDAALAASDITLNGIIGRDLATTGSSLDLYGTVGRDVNAKASDITLADGARVGGNLDYTGNNKISQAAGAHVGGKITQHQPQAKHHPFFRLLFFSGTFAVFVALMLIISALVITALLPRFVHSVSQQGKERPWWSLLTGLAASIIVPILFVLLMASVVGIPLGILLLLFWLLISLSSGLFSAYLLGRWIWRSQRNPLVIVLVGSVVLIILYIIPIVDFIVLILATWLGEGMLLLELKNRTPRPKYRLE